MQTIIRVVGACVCLLCLAPFARAEFLFSQSFESAGGNAQGPLRFSFEFTDDIAWAGPVAPLFDQPITGGFKSYFANNSTPFFLENIARATDGKNGRVGFSVLNDRGGEGGLRFEASFFFGAPNVPFYAGKADLQGKLITGAILHVDHYLTKPSSEPGLYDYDLKVTVGFYDDTIPEDDPVIFPEYPQNAPEPGSCCLAILGSLGIACVAARRRWSKWA